MITPADLRVIADAVAAPHSPASESCNKVARRLRKTADELERASVIEDGGEGKKRPEKIPPFCNMCGTRHYYDCDIKAPPPEGREEGGEVAQPSASDSRASGGATVRPGGPVVSEASPPSAISTTTDGPFEFAHVQILWDALNKVRSYNVDIHCGKINYRPEDHISLIDCAMSAFNAATLSPSPVPQEAGKHIKDGTEYGWVIERADSPISAPLYWSGVSKGDIEDPSPWTADNMNAIRFATEISARVVAHNLMGRGAGHVQVRVCEHAWIYIADSELPDAPFHHRAENISPKHREMFPDPNRRAPSPSPAEQEAWSCLLHLENEWADMATNGLQWLRNIRDGISDPAKAIAEMEANLKRIRALPRPPSHPAQPVEVAEVNWRAAVDVYGAHDAVKAAGDKLAAALVTVQGEKASALAGFRAATEKQIAAEARAKAAEAWKSKALDQLLYDHASKTQISPTVCWGCDMCGAEGISAEQIEHRDDCLLANSEARRFLSI